MRKSRPAIRTGMPWADLTEHAVNDTLKINAPPEVRQDDVVYVYSDDDRRMPMCVGERTPDGLVNLFIPQVLAEGFRDGISDGITTIEIDWDEIQREAEGN